MISSREIKNRVHIEYHLPNGARSDFVIRCGNTDHEVHKSILSTASTFFAAACNGRFKEASTGILVLPDDDPSTVAQMLEFLYKYDCTDSYKGTDGESLTVSDRLITALLLDGIADKYDIPKLTSFANSKFVNLASHFLWPEDSFIDVVAMAYECTTRKAGIYKNIVHEICAANINRIFDQREWQLTMSEHESFALAMADATAELVGSSSQDTTAEIAVEELVHGCKSLFGPSSRDVAKP